jgi:NDP-sugar pyrophosphorylase family protein
MKKIKAVISAGGTGGALWEITGGVVPKSLCRIVDKPLINYQLEAFKKLGVSDIFVSFNKDWQVQLFEEAIRIGDVPSCNYVLSLHEHGHPFKTFADQSARDFISGCDFVWSWGDLYFESSLIEQLFGKPDEFSVCCESPKLNKFNPVKGKTYLSYEKNRDGRLESCDLVSGAGSKKVGLHVPLYLRSLHADYLTDVVDKGATSLKDLIINLVDDGKLCAVQPGYLINVNTKTDLDVLLEKLCPNSNKK